MSSLPSAALFGVQWGYVAEAGWPFREGPMTRGEAEALVIELAATREGKHLKSQIIAWPPPLVAEVAK
jgi:hypothetical protein